MNPGRKRLLWISAKTLALSGVACVLFVAFAPLLRSTENFLPLPADPRVRYEPGAENAAAILARALPDAIATIQRGQPSRPLTQKPSNRSGSVLLVGTIFSPPANHAKT